MASSPRPRPTSRHSSSSRLSKPPSNRQTRLYAHWGGRQRQLGLALFWRLEVLSPSIPRLYCLASRASLLFASLKRLYIASTCACWQVANARFRFKIMSLFLDLSQSLPRLLTFIGRCRRSP